MSSDRIENADANLASLVAAKRELGVDRLLLQIHDASFPSDPDEDCGRGSPYSRGAERLFQFARQLGFDGIQLGPRGKTPRGNPSPYEGTLFSRNPLNLPLARLVEQGRIRRETFEAIRASIRAASNPPPQLLLEDVFQQAIDDIVLLADTSDRTAAREFLAANESWLVPDALYEALCAEHQAGWWGAWNRTPQGEFDQRLFDPRPGDEQATSKRLAALRDQNAALIENYALIQWLLTVEHQRLRSRLAQLGLVMFADLQIGLAAQDTWARRHLFLSDYKMGAPPSRTNPDGQPWGFSVFDPAKFGTLAEPGPVLQFVRKRLDQALAECDGVRIDHPHGWVDPWVYRADDPDPLHAVQNGARLFSSPDDPLHAHLRDWAIARADQIDRTEPPYADYRVHSLDESQVTRYALFFDTIVASLDAHGHSRSAIACEVLSTMPYPLRCVLQRHGLGRFRVTQKLKLDDLHDGYRVENAAPEDWIMLGTHDTATIWELAPGWCNGVAATAWGRYLATLLVPEPQRSAFAANVAGSPGELIHGLFAALLASRAQNVSVFFSDLFGLTERYNRPGVLSESNWRLRVPADFEQLYADRVQQRAALDVRGCLQLAASSSRRR